MYKNIFVQVTHKDKILFGLLGEANNPVYAMCDVFEEIKNIVKKPKDIELYETILIEVKVTISDKIAKEHLFHFFKSEKDFQIALMHTILDLIEELWDEEENNNGE